MIPATSTYKTALAAFKAGFLPVVITIAGYSKVFTNYKSGISGQVDWLDSMDDCSTSINDMEGGANQTSLSFTVQDNGHFITGSFPSFTFEGKQVTVQIGLPGLSQVDFPTFFTGFIDTVESVNANNDYYFTCSDISSQLGQVIYPNGDSGMQIGSSNPKTLLAHPLDLLLDILGTQVGFNLIPDADNFDLTWNMANAGGAGGILASSTGGALGGSSFVYTGTGAASAFKFPMSKVFSVTPGKVYIFSCYLDCSHVTAGNPNAGIWDTPVAVNYVNVNGVTGAALTQLVAAPWTCPPGVTQVRAIVDTSNCTVANAQPLTWSNPQLSLVGSSNYINSTKIRSYRDGIYSGLQMQFRLTQSVAAADFIKQQILKPLGGYMWVDSLGQITVNFFTPLVAPAAVATLGPAVWNGIPEAEQVDIINTVQFQFDKDDATANSSNNYLAVGTEIYQPSVTKYGSQFGEQVIQADGFRSGFQGFFTSRLVSRIIFSRYGLKNLKFDQSAPDSIWQTCLLEPGDIVAVTHNKVPDRVAGTFGVTGKLFEVLNRTFKFSTGQMNLTMLDASYLSVLGLSKIALDAGSDYNLFIAPSDFANAGWTSGGASVSTNTDVAPDGTTTADTITDSSAVAFQSIAQNVSIPADGTAYEVVLFVKKTTSATNTFGLNINNQSVNVAFPRLNTNTGNFTGATSCALVGNYWKLVTSLTNPGTWTILGFALQPSTGTNSGSNPAPSDSASATGSAVCWGAGIRKVTESNTYMFLCSDQDTYSNGDAAHVLG